MFADAGKLVSETTTAAVGATAHRHLFGGRHD